MASVAGPSGGGTDRTPRWHVLLANMGSVTGLVRITFLTSLAVILGLAIAAMVVVTNDIETVYNDGLYLNLIADVGINVRNGRVYAFTMLAFPNNATVLQAAATDLTLTAQALTFGLPALRVGNASLGAPEPVVSPEITSDLDAMAQPANATLEAIAVIQQQILVLGETSLSPTTTAAINTVIIESIVINMLLLDIRNSTIGVSTSDLYRARRNQFIFLSIIIGLIVLDVLFVYIPVERRIHHMVQALTTKNEQLGLLADQLSKVTQLNPNGIFRTDAGGRLMFVNERWCEITGLCDGDLDRWIEHVAPESWPQEQQQWWRALTEPVDQLTTAVSTEFLYERPDQLGMWIHAQARPEVDEQGRVCGMIGTFGDVTERKRLEQEKMDVLTLAASQAEAHVREQARFVDIVCHEIRNPLNGIVNSADALHELHTRVRDHLRHQPPSDESAVELLRQLDETADLWDAIELCTRHQRRITDDVLQISRLREGRFSLLNTAFWPQQLMDAIVNMFRAEAAAGGVTLGCTFSSTSARLLRALGDPQRISQILINLVSNAVKFTQRQPGAREVAIEVDVEPPSPCVGETACLIVRVRDTGIGMSVAELQRLFVPFGQADTRTYSRYGGSGMGLFITKALLDVMGGSIAVASEPGRGTTFTVVIPCERLPDDTPIDVDVPGLIVPAGRDAEPLPPTQHGQPPSTLQVQPSLSLPSPTRPPSPPPPAPLPRSSQLRVLVVEDNNINQRVLRRQLEMAPGKPYVVDVAGNGQEAVDATERAEYAVIIMDVEMPVMGGLEATRRIRARESEQGRPPAVIIGLSGNAREEHVQAGLASGMTDYLSKPCRQPALLGCIAKRLHPA